MAMDSLSNRLHQPKLAIDVGGVIVISSTTDTDNGISSRNVVESTCQILDRSTPTVECADAVSLLVNHFGPETTFILSKCKSQTQLATMRFLWRGITGGGGGGSFFERTGLLPQNVLFCKKRSGGSALDLEMEELIRHDGSTTGAKVAVGDVGKGAIARKFDLTHFMEECLLSDMFEGYLVGPHLINSQGREVADDSSSIEGMLIHFGVSGRLPVRNEVYNFISGHGVKLKAKQREEAVDDCLAKWIVAAGWAGVLQSFGIQKPP